MKIKRIGSGGVYEAKVGYVRAVVVDGWVHVAGTVGEGADVVAQCEAILQTIGRALEEAGSDFAHVVQVRYILPDREEFPACWPVLAKVFGANPPAATMVECGLIDPKYRIEIEVTAVVAREHSDPSC